MWMMNKREFWIGLFVVVVAVLAILAAIGFLSGWWEVPPELKTE